jgi:hypothetical protein
VLVTLTNEDRVLVSGVADGFATASAQKEAKR